jgi:hypothetical protein
MTDKTKKIIRDPKTGRIIKPVGQNTNKNGTAGRPTKMTVDVLAKLDQAFAIGASDVEACAFAEISQDALYDYQRKFPEYCERKARLKERPILKAKNTIVAALNDPIHARWYLEKKRKDEFGNALDLTSKGESVALPITGVRIVKDDTK